MPAKIVGLWHSRGRQPFQRKWPLVTDYRSL